MAWVRLVAFCGALVALPATASAQELLSQRLRVQGGFTHEDRALQPAIDDVWLGVTPELSAVFVRPRTFTELTYSVTGAMHSQLPVELANRMTLGVSHEVSKRTQLFVSAEVFQTSLTNLLTSGTSADTELAVLPAADSRFLGVRGAEGLSWEASPRVRIGQSVGAAFVTSLDTAPMRNYVVNALVSADHTWKLDALGGEVRAAYAANEVTPKITQRVVTFTAGPRWRHDFSPRLSTFVALGGTLILSPDPGTGIVVASAARGSLLYSLATARLDLSVVSGAEPNLLTGQILRTNQVSLRATVPLSERHRVFGGASIGYLRGGNLLVRRADLSGDFQGILADADVIWTATDSFQLFARYQFFDQIADDTPLRSNPAVVRSAALVGIQFFTVPPGRTNGRFREPQRVDRSDGAASAP
jgi:hypothetical protein